MESIEQADAGEVFPIEDLLKWKPSTRAISKSILCIDSRKSVEPD
jgi:hypothetical protein